MLLVRLPHVNIGLWHRIKIVKQMCIIATANSDVPVLFHLRFKLNWSVKFRTFCIAWFCRVAMKPWSVDRKHTYNMSSVCRCLYLSLYKWASVIAITDNNINTITTTNNNRIRKANKRQKLRL